MEQTVNYLTDHIYQIIGIIGFALYVANYLLLSFKWISSDTVPYFAINLAASSFVLVSLVQSFNLASLLIQLFWICISIIAIVIRLGRPASSEALS